MSKIVIAVDGFSSTGKSTVAKQLANKLKYVYVDTGAMYRAVALYAIQNNLATNGAVDTQGLEHKLDEIEISFVYNVTLGFSETYLNNVNVESEIRGLEVSSYVSKVAAISRVRQKLVVIQQQLGLEKGIVMDGRDIGTVVFPEAELKLFMTASPQIRAQRRYDELVSKGEEKVTFEDVYHNVVERDHLDTTRKESPLVKAADAVEVDNSDMTREEQLSLILDLVSQKS